MAMSRMPEWLRSDRPLRSTGGRTSTGCVARPCRSVQHVLRGREVDAPYAFLPALPGIPQPIEAVLDHRTNHRDRGFLVLRELMFPPKRCPAGSRLRPVDARVALHERSARDFSRLLFTLL